jgi:hypothetical protein
VNVVGCTPAPSTEVLRFGVIVSGREGLPRAGLQWTLAPQTSALAASNTRKVAYQLRAGRHRRRRRRSHPRRLTPGGRATDGSGRFTVSIGSAGATDHDHVADTGYVAIAGL